ncbi:MAG: ACT domain-containing protein [Pseudomonadota bacterium]
MSAALRLKLGDERLAVVRLDPESDIPAWALVRSHFSSISRTPDELSIVCDESQVPDGARIEGGWRALKVEGPLDFGLTGILAAIADPLARAGVSIFAISTFDTDYVLVKDDKVNVALAALCAAGHFVAA